MKLSLIWQLWLLVRSQPVPLHAMQMPQPTLKQASFHIKQVELVGDNQKRCKFSCSARKGRGVHELIRQCFWIALTSAYRKAIRPAPSRGKTATCWSLRKCPETTGSSKGQARLLRQNKKLHHGDASCVLKNSIWKVDKRAAIHNIKCWNRPKKEKVHTYCRNVLKHNYHIRMCFTQLDHNSNKQDIFSVDIFQQKGVTFC